MGLVAVTWHYAMKLTKVHNKSLALPPTWRR